MDTVLKQPYFLSICIPAYNRTKELSRLFESIDTKYGDEIEIVVAEDMSPERAGIKQIVEQYKKNTKCTVCYFENEENYGYDKNIRQIAKRAQGKWIMYMGNDDVFIKGSLDRFIEWLKEHNNLGYVLRRYRAIRPGQPDEEHRYALGDVFFEPGEAAVVELFRRSIFISGFTFHKDCFEDYDCDEFDGTLMFQCYILSMVCMNNSSAYCDIPITGWMTGGIPDFGRSEAEKDLYTVGENSFENSINFLSQVGKMAERIDRMLGTDTKLDILKSYSKYSYGYLIEHRDDGVSAFREYAREIKRLGLGNSPYFYIYYYALLLLGKKKCQYGVRFIKKVIGRTPRL